MATLITKNSQTASAVPSAGSLSVGELAVNTADGKLYTKHSNGTVKEIGAAAPSFASGTVMLFVQSSAPTGWTKSTTHDNKALRVVSGTASSGGSVGFTTAFGTPSVSGSVSATTLSTSQIPSHSHSTPTIGNTNADGTSYFRTTTITKGASTSSKSTNAEGGGGSHTHSMSGVTATINVSYVDVIIATKD